MIEHAIKSYKDSFSGLPKDIWLLSLIMFLNRMGTMVLFFLGLYLIEVHNYDETKAGYIIMTFGVGSLFASYLGGELAGKFGAVRVQIAGLLLSGISFIVFGQMDSFLMIGVMAFVTALTADIVRPANITLIAEICPGRNNTRAFSLNRLAINLGMAIGPFFGGMLAEVNYHLLFYVDGATCLIAGTALIFIFRKRKFIPHEEETKVIKKSPYRDIPFLVMLVVMFLFAISFFQLFSTWPVYLKKIYTYSEFSIGVFMAINALLVVIIEMPFVMWLENKNITRVLITGAVFTFAGLFILPFNGAAWFIILIVLLFSLGEIMVFPFASTFISRRTNNNNRGKYFGLFTLTFAFAMILAPLYGFHVMEYLGNDVVWYFMLPIGIAATLLLMLNGRLASRE